MLANGQQGATSSQHRRDLWCDLWKLRPQNGSYLDKFSDRLNDLTIKCHSRRKTTPVYILIYTVYIYIELYLTEFNCSWLYISANLRYRFTQFTHTICWQCGTPMKSSRKLVSPNNQLRSHSIWPTACQILLCQPPERQKRCMKRLDVSSDLPTFF